MNKSPSPHEFIRHNRAMYLGGEQPSGKTLAVRLADCALRSGARRLELLVLSDGWMAVTSDADWITPNLRGLRTSTMEGAFRALTPLLGGQPNEIRFEAIVAAFSKDVCVRSQGNWYTISGENPSLGVQSMLGNNAFAVLFKADDNS